jgi:sugar phosphate isomerase/epimerase
MINLGISSACFYPLETEASLELIGKNGIKTTEIFFNSFGELKDPFVKELLHIKNNYGIEIVSIHPTFSLAESFMLFSGYGSYAGL